MNLAAFVALASRACWADSFTPELEYKQTDGQHSYAVDYYGWACSSPSSDKCANGTLQFTSLGETVLAHLAQKVVCRFKKGNEAFHLDLCYSLVLNSPVAFPKTK